MQKDVILYNQPTNPIGLIGKRKKRGENHEDNQFIQNQQYVHDVLL